MAGNMAFLLDEVGYPRHGYAAGASVPSSVSSTAEAMLISIDDLAAAAAWLAAAEPQLEQFASAGCFVGTPCVAAHSTTRNLYKTYTGPLYQVNRSSDHSVVDVPTGAFGYADVAVQDAFCTNTDCTISIIYDQSARKNHLTIAPPGGAHHATDAAVNATRLPITMQGHKVYGAYFEGGMGYRNDVTSGVATGNAEETMYMVTSGTHVNGGCCFDYGNAETNNLDTGAGSMEAIYFGTCKVLHA